MIAAFCLIIPASGLLGAIPFGVMTARLLGTTDPRESGSGNIGATNVMRTGGWRGGILTLLLDAGKGAAAVLLARYAAQSVGLPALEPVAALTAVLGHIFSPFTGFRGGKGVAPGLGAFGLVMPGPAAVAVLVFIAAVAATRYVSIGSILAAGALPLAGFWMGYPGMIYILCGVAALLVIWKHQDNIGRLMRGQEHRIGGKKEEAAP